jgi:hypothetical protein
MCFIVIFSVSVLINFVSETSVEYFLSFGGAYAVPIDLNIHCEVEVLSNWQVCEIRKLRYFQFGYLTVMLGHKVITWSFGWQNE